MGLGGEGMVSPTAAGCEGAGALMRSNEVPGVVVGVVIGVKIPCKGASELWSFFGRDIEWWVELITRKK